MRSALAPLGLLVALGFCSRVATATEADATTSASPVRGPEATRTRVIVRLDDAFDEQQQRALATLLSAELAASGARASIERSESPLAAWLDDTRSRNDVLLVVAVDAHELDSLELYVVDAARGRAIVRRLPGGIESNAALVEAIVSIVASAAAALREGLEVASRPLAEIVPKATTTAPSPAPATQPAATQTAAASAATAPSKAGESAAAPGADRVRFGAGLGATVGSFVADHAPSFGVVPSLILRPVAALGVHAAAALYWPSDFDTSAGSFSIGRSRFDLTLSYSRDFAAFSLEPELGVALELLRREVLEPGPSVQSTDDATFARVGPLGRLRARYALSRLLGVELAANLAYFPREIRFVAEGETTQELAVPLHWAASAELGFYILSWKE